MEAPPRFVVCKDVESVAASVAVTFDELARAAVAERGRFAVALAGGSTPRRAYEILSDEYLGWRLPWNHIHLFFGDERCVPEDHPESNFRMARETLLSRVPVPAPNVHPMRCEGDPELAARAYETELRDFFGDADWPRFDLVMLGMGEDGHTASLFPDSPALGERAAWVVAARVEKLNSTRLTLTLPVINHARHLLLTVTGAAKRNRLKEVLPTEPGAGPLPVQLLRPDRGRLEWFLDEAAAPAFLAR